jgi:electron transport complex protein RnfG
MAEKKKIESTFLNMFIVLTAIALISALALGFTYNQTKDLIDAAKIEKKNKAIKEVIPVSFDNDPNSEVVSIEEFEGVEIYPAKKDGEIVGIAIKTYSNNGFSGYVSIMIGFDINGNISVTSVLEHGETPGLGSKMVEDKFQNQFKDKNPENYTLKLKKDGGNVDAITAATISSRAFCDAMRRAYDVYKAYISGGEYTTETSATVGFDDVYDRAVLSKKGGLS